MQFQGSHLMNFILCDFFLFIRGKVLLYLVVERFERRVKMKEVKIDELQELLNSFANKDIYIHLETTNGSYATHYDANVFNAGAFIRNARIRYELGKVVDDAPHRVGLKMEHGWVYAQGITHFELDEQGRLLMAGLDYSGKLAIALEISETPFSY